MQSELPNHSLEATGDAARFANEGVWLGCRASMCSSEPRRLRSRPLARTLRARA